MSAQILAALLDNAVRHTPAGGTTTVDARPQHGLAQASVNDTGNGIPEAQLPRMFERFYHAEEAHTRRGCGTGPGLDIARDLALAHGGVFSAGNAAAGGARFTLSCPPAPERRNFRKQSHAHQGRQGRPYVLRKPDKPDTEQSNPLT